MLRPLAQYLEQGALARTIRANDGQLAAGTAGQTHKDHEHNCVGVDGVGVNGGHTT
jgi:hypothetical protein